jgi:enoyl-CoA hydratase
MTEIKKTPDGIEVPPPGPNDVLYEVEENIATITLNRPTILNAMNKNVLRLLDAALTQANDDDNVHVVILRGAGRSFSAGGDLHAALYPDDDPAPGGLEVQIKIWSLQKPVIASVRGHAIGQACELAGVCDLTVASENARFGEIQIRHGFGPPVLITPFLTSLKRAKEILLLGEQIDAVEAKELGLVNRVVADADLESETRQLATKMSSLPQKAVRLNKLLVNRAYELAGFMDSLNYRDDPIVKALSEEESDDPVAQERQRILREDGWQAFLKTRDIGYQ